MSDGAQLEAVEEARRKSDLSRAFAEDGARKTHVGGQALLEGVMMRGRYNWAVAVREPSGNVYLEEHDLASGRKKNGWMSWPLVRGCRALVESLMLGYKALEIAALHAFADEEEDPTRESVEEVDDAPALEQSSQSCGTRLMGDVDSLRSSSGESDLGPEVTAGSSAQDKAFSWKDDFGRPDTMIDALGAQTTLEVVEAPAEGSAEKAAAESGRAASLDKEASSDQEASSDKEASFGKKEMAVSMVIGLVLGVVLFIGAPALLTNLIVGEYDSNTMLWNIVDGLLRVLVFVFYLWLIGRMSDIKRMFGYHGAEHKTIHCYEHGLPLTPENARSFPRLHVRCGTAFLIMVMVIAIFVYTVTPINALIAAWGVPDGAPKLALVIVSRIVLMPVIAGISYEITVRWAGSHPDNPLVKVILWPGMQMQYLTTNEPDDGQIECAIAAMQRVLEREEVEKGRADGDDHRGAGLEEDLQAIREATQARTH
ncbi:MAG: DUF1385 domain-containing protein [Gordonibacter sp.]|uniref:DUF1385 domain-containing protein n=5 Tax=Gordonibacter sp. TaxID=1968902 RepID=UPI002FCB5679